MSKWYQSSQNSQKVAASDKASNRLHHFLRKKVDFSSCGFNRFPRVQLEAIHGQQKSSWDEQEQPEECVCVRERERERESEREREDDDVGATGVNHSSAAGFLSLSLFLFFTLFLPLSLSHGGYVSVEELYRQEKARLFGGVLLISSLHINCNLLHLCLPQLIGYPLLLSLLVSAHVSGMPLLPLLHLVLSHFITILLVFLSLSHTHTHSVSYLAAGQARSFGLLNKFVRLTTHRISEKK